MDLALQQAIDAHPVITFDVYDTLVCRVIYKDRDLWQLVDREYQKRNHAKPIGFYKKRETADHKARKTYPYREVTLVPCWRNYKKWVLKSLTKMKESASVLNETN